MYLYLIKSSQAHVREGIYSFDLYEQTLEQNPIYTEEEMLEFEAHLARQEEDLIQKTADLQKQREELQRQQEQLNAQKLELQQVRKKP